MDDWQLAIGIIIIAIIVAIILSKRSWAHGKKKREPVEHYTNTRDKLSGLDETESTNTIGTVFAVVVGLVSTFFIVKFIMWLFSKVPGWIAAIAPLPSANTTGWANYPNATGGTLLSNISFMPFILVTMVIIIVLIAFGNRAFRRNGVLFFMFTAPILYILGVPFKWLIIAGIILIPIIVWRSMGRLY